MEPTPLGFEPSLMTALITGNGEADAKSALELLYRLGFSDVPIAWQRFRSLCESESQRRLCFRFLPALLDAFREAATPDGSLLNFQRFVESVADRERLFETLAQQPRTVEILVKLFVGSQFLTEILIRNPHHLDRLTEQKRLAEFKSRADFIEQGRMELSGQESLPEVMDQLRRFQQWELLRLAACDKFGLLDLKTVTLQLSLLADSLVQISLEEISRRIGAPLDDLVVLAFGKLGGEELNYSSDVDLVFVCREESPHHWQLGQQLVRMLDEGTSLGFLYRVDLRLRPWGGAGALVTTAAAYVNYLEKHGQLWEKQALLKARPIAGNLALGSELLQRLEPFVFAVSPQAVKQNIRALRQQAEQELSRRGKLWGEVKSGPGGIRDIEFLTQYLQLIHGERRPGIRSINTLDSLIRLAEHELIFPDEYRRLSSGYLFLRTVEHALQLMHNRQEHRLPTDVRSLEYLAGRLDYPDAETFLKQYERYTCAVREVFENYLLLDQHPVWAPSERESSEPAAGERSQPDEFTPFEHEIHQQLLRALTPEQVVQVQALRISAREQKLTIVGRDGIGALSAICGLLFVGGFDIVSGTVLAGVTTEDSQRETDSLRDGRSPLQIFLNEFIVRQAAAGGPGDSVQDWTEFERELNELLLQTLNGGSAAGRLVHRVAAAMEQASGRLPRSPRSPSRLLPVEIDFAQGESADVIALNIHGEDIPGFLYELTNAIAVSGLSIQKMTIATRGNQVVDTLTVVDHQQRLQHPERIHELRAAIVLIKHFTHLLPDSPNPEAALLHFQEFLANLFRQPDWLEQLSPLSDSKVLAALATLLGNSDFLWDDFLRLQHENLFPVVTDVQGLQQPKGLSELRNEIQALLDAPQMRHALNAFKDREMMRVDMRHILGLQNQFGRFGLELTDVAEAVVGGALTYCEQQLQRLHGVPRSTEGQPARLSLCALGKFGGRELGYASDIELIFLYDEEGETSGPEPLSNAEYFHRLVQLFQQTIQSRRKGIFEVDLRLRPYGAAGSPAVSLEAFRNYFQPQGPAWPYERQALVKLRPVAGDTGLGQTVVQLRDEWIYRGEPFDVAAMRAMREKQIRQLVRAGTFNAKLSPGGLVDCEYLVQGLQMTYGHLDPAIREPHTREAMKALEARGILTGTLRTRLRDAYRFWRRVIDALRVVRGDASDLTVPPYNSDEFLFLSRRLGDRTNVDQLRHDLEHHSRQVIEISASLQQLMQRPVDGR